MYVFSAHNINACLLQYYLNYYHSASSECWSSHSFYLFPRFFFIWAGIFSQFSTYQKLNTVLLHTQQMKTTKIVFFIIYCNCAISRTLCVVQPLTGTLSVKIKTKNCPIPITAYWFYVCIFSKIICQLNVKFCNRLAYFI